ncbi:hypothetical protein BCV69DRAFT_175157 [Microstroma glucosiphilum]|uniref:Uncharacterized protein n=1 Tax=Pseudomicrostroma glucosiphilum TaxID=1684307 RepID=A0A316U8Q4_9BASI|nr:hypothetical protein BCV69DRAFT_175157 [Pseudomicrostroma glucosiphilum]PWN21596.1 hypothetical protein BCV69DRAFT_175157 [Pseudomicrostroma glucosiphilum]
MSTLQSTSSPSMSYFSTPNQMGGDVATEAFFSPTPQGSLRSSGSSNPGFAHQQGQNFASTAQLTQDFSQMGTSSQSSPAIGSSNYASNLQQPLGDYNSGESRLFPVISRQQFQAQFATNDLPPQASGSTQVAQANVDDNWMLSDLTSLRSPGLKRFAGDHLEDPRPRSPGTSGSLRRPASFPILSSVGSNGAVPVPINDAVPQAQASSSTGPHRRTISNNANNNAMTTSRVNLRRLASGTGPVVGGSPQHHQQQQQQQQQQLRGGVKMGDRADMRHHRSNLSLSALSQYPGSHPPPSDAVEGSLVESPLTSSSLSSFNGGTAGGPQFTFSVPSNSGYASGSHLNGSGNNQGAHPSASAGLASERRGQDERERNLGGAAHFSTVSSLPIVGHLPNTQYSHPTPSARTSPITSLQAATPVSYQQQKMNTSPYSTANGGLGFDISSRPSRASSAMSTAMAMAAPMAMAPSRRLSSFELLSLHRRP